MGWVMMSERELNRVEVLSQVLQGRMSAVTAADVLDLSRRQVHRLLKRFGADGAAAIRPPHLAEALSFRITFGKQD